MTEVSYEQHIEQQLADLSIARNLGQTSLRSTAVTGLEDFDKGSPIWIALGAEKQASPDLMTVGWVAGRVVEPDLGLVDISHNPNYPIGLIDQYDRIGLAVQVESKDESAPNQIHAGRIAGMGRFAFYLPQDITRDNTGNLFIASQDIVRTNALYANVQINKTVMFDFTSRSKKVA